MRPSEHWPASPRAALSSFQLRSEPGLDPAWLPFPAMPAGTMTAAPHGSGPVDALELMRMQHWGGPEALLLVTGRDLAAPGCASVFGYADRRLRMAAVSTFRLKSPDARLTRERVTKVAIHELLHLEGRRHCKDPFCAMHPASNLEELDRRGMQLCERCRRPARRWRAAVLAAAACLVFSFAVDASLKALVRKASPFSWRRQPDGAEVLYRKSAVLKLPGEAEARTAAEVLNRLFAEIDPPPLTVRAEGPRARVVAGPWTVFEIDAAAGGGYPAEEFARQWAARMEPLLQGKGSASEGCPDCHTFRREEVRQAILQRTRLWR